MSDAITIHLIAALPALVLGAIVLARPKGTAIHRALGRVWAGLMMVVAISSFWIRGIDGGGGYSVIHLLSVLTIFGIGFAVYSIRRGKPRAHRGWMIGTYCGLVGAGLGTLAPGRLISDFLFG